MRPLEHLDLNLLRLFEAVMREGSITRASAAVGLSQPAASNALKRLRTYCGDPLFVRTATGLRPTPMASAILPTVAQSLRALQGTLDEYRSFDPSRSTRTFHLLMLDVGELMYMPRLTAHLLALAPGLRITCRQIERDRYAHALAAGEADLALGQVPPGQPELMHQRLSDEPLLCLVGRGHAAERARAITRQQFLDTPHVAIRPEVMMEARIAQAMGADYTQRRVMLEVHHFMAMPLVLAQSPLLAVIPQSVANTFEPQLGLRRLPLPYPVEPVHVSQFWHRRSQHDTGHRWLRGEIAQLFRQMPERPRATG